MESLQLIKNRIQGIGSTRQITQSMRLVSTSKVQRARTRMTENRPFLEEARQLVQIAGKSLGGSRHRYLADPPTEANRAAVMVISGDRGLCGGYNMNVVREATALIKTIGDARIVTVGVKARDYLRRRYRDKVAHSFIGISENPFPDDAREIAAILLDWFHSGEVDKVYVVYTRFESMLAQTPLVEQLLPLAIPEPEAPSPSLTRCEPDGEAFLAQAVPFYLSAFLYGAILESSACEQSARIISMDSAVKNADEMIESLTLLYNQARQGAITQELIEIVGGANAV